MFRQRSFNRLVIDKGAMKKLVFAAGKNTDHIYA